MDFNNDNLKKSPSENKEQYLWRIGTYVDKEMYRWKDISPIINKELGIEEDKYFDESAFRKPVQYAKKYYENVFSKMESEEYYKKLEEKENEIEKKRIKLRTELIERNKWLREEVRDEMILEKIIESIKSLSFDQLPTPEPISPKREKREYLLCFGDEHFGVEFELKDLFGNVLNSYSPEIFKKRMDDLLAEVIDIILKEDISTLHIFSMGDFVDGVLRVSQLMKLRFGVIDSVIKYSEYMAKWFTCLSHYVRIKVHFVNGNHTELRMINQPKGTFVNENMGKVMIEFIKLRLENNPNFKIIENPSGLAYANLCNFTILGIHGEVKNMNNAIDNFSRTYGVPIDYLIAGHLHHSKTETVGINQEVINVPSVIGVDDYSLSLNKTSNAGATLLVFEQFKGKIIEYDIKL